jgi:hypothetical protein
MQSTLKLILVRCLSSLHVKLVYLIKTSSGDYSYNKKDHAKAYLANLDPHVYRKFQEHPCW